ncbi:MAG TPA: portal protein [Hyphomicrobium sp.]|nr:portal protein [Hyphomicrobium sp.]HRO48772.1 portal protein [Hyphomicrobium sp.]
METVALSTLAKERSPKEMRAHCARAFLKAQPYHREVNAINRYMMPWRQSTIERAPEGGGKTEGAPLADEIFDGTALAAAANYPGQMMADWWPLHQEFLKLDSGPFVPEGTDREMRKRDLDEVTKRIHAVSAAPQLAGLDMFADHFAGTGAMFLEKGDADTIINAAAPPIVELAIEDGPWGQPWHIFWKRNYRLDHLPGLWPNGQVGSDLAEAIKNNPAETKAVVQYAYFELASKTWRQAVWVDGFNPDAPLLHEAETRTCPWMTPRMFKVPGEGFGRGIAHLALPFARTANRGRELALKAAVFAILGLWLRRNDNVFNPRTALMDPGAMWQVASTGGALGPSLVRLPVPQDFDISHIVMEDERQQMRRVMLDDELPSEQDPVRSATEIAGRLRRYSRNRGGTGARLSWELMTPYARRVCEILEDFGLIPRGITIDQIVTLCLVTAPAAAAQSTDRVERAVNWIQMIVMLMGPQAALLVAKVEELLPEIGRWMGNDERFIRGKEEVKELKDMLMQMVARQQAAAAQQQQEAPPPAQQYVNGGAM